jgi:hypothetical protein
MKAPVFRKAGKNAVITALAVLLVFLSCGENPGAGTENELVPSQYGKVWYRCNPESPTQLYIIGISHRDALTRANGKRTPRVQAEVYKIGEWLIRNVGVEMCLPEGFFVEGNEACRGKTKSCGPIASAEWQSLPCLEAKLSDETTFITAEMLLKSDFPLVMKQVEDKCCYMSVHQKIEQLYCCENNAETSSLIESELEYHQQKRLGAMLQNIPGIVNEELRHGHIQYKKAFFTIGLSHIPDIIRYAEEKKITIQPPLTPTKYAQIDQELNLARDNFGISVIIPKTLAEDHEILRMTGLEPVPCATPSIITSQDTKKRGNDSPRLKVNTVISSN